MCHHETLADVTTLTRITFDRKTFNVCLTDYRQCPKLFILFLCYSRLFGFIESQAQLLCEPYIVRAVFQVCLHSMMNELVTRARDKKNGNNIKLKWIINTASRLVSLRINSLVERASAWKKCCFEGGFFALWEFTFQYFFQISYNRYIQLKRSHIKMKSLVIIFIACLSSCHAYGDDKKPAKAIAVLSLSDKVFGSMWTIIF